MSDQKDTRSYYKSIILGFNETGKTFFVRYQYAQEILKADPSKKVVLVTANYDDETMAGIKQAHSFDELKRFKRGLVLFWDQEVYFKEGENGIFLGLYHLSLSGHLKKGAIIIDDATQYFPNGKISKVIGAYLTNYRHLSLDFMFIFHAFKDVPPALWRKIHYCSVKWTNESNKDFKFFEKDRDMPNAKAFYDAYKLLDKASKFFKNKPSLKYKTINVSTGIK